jgi:hypothetical protein
MAKQEAARKTLDQAAAKMTSAQAGEILEKNQQSEKLEVIEQPTVPQHAIKPNRLKVALTAVVVAIGAGAFLAYLAESLDTGIRYSTDLASIIDRQFVSAIPFISTHSERRRKNGATYLIALALIAGLVGAAISAKSFVPQVHEALTKTKGRVSQ